MTTRRTLTTLAATGLLASTLGLAGCSDDTSGDEAGTDVGDIQEEAGDDPVEPYDGVYDSTFYSDIDSYEGEEVTVSADVNEVITANTFTIAGTDDTTVEPLLIVSTNEVGDVEPGMAVVVTGVVRTAFDLPTVEGDLGLDLEDGPYDGFDQDPYIEASVVEPATGSDG